MASRINTFRPNEPINPGMFVGRISEIDRLERHLRQTSAGFPSNFLITGERGIGKTSLLNYFKATAQGLFPELHGDLRFLVVDTDVDENTTQVGLMKKIELGISRELGESEPIRVLLNKAWAFLKRVEAGGVKLKQDEPSIDEILPDEFANSVAEIVGRVCRSPQDQTKLEGQYDGLLILIDEADNASKQLKLGLFLKLFLERLGRRQITQVMIGLAGLETLQNVLLRDHRSALRLFDIITLHKLQDSDVRAVVNIVIDRANEVNSDKTQVDEGGMQALIKLSEGYPHFVQQYGWSAFEQDTDGVIDVTDVVFGATMKGGALELIGNRYYRNDFYNRIYKESYRQVLRIMSKYMDEWVSKPQIRSEYRGRGRDLDNALKALRDRHIIVSKEGQRGVYRLQHKGFALWIATYTEKPEVMQMNIEAYAAISAQAHLDDKSPSDDTSA